MPTYQRLGHALDALDSVLAQETRIPFEILVLDNAIEPELEQAVIQRQQATDVPLSYVPVADIGLHNGRHAAAVRAAGELLLFIDDDIIADPHWLSAMVEAFEDEEVQLATGPVLPEYEMTPPDWLDGFWHHIGQGKRWCGHLSLLDLGPTRQEIDATLVFGANFAIRKDTLFALGGFHPDSLPWSLRRYRGDGETAVSLAAREQGMKAVYQPAARVRHRVPVQRLTLEYFERRSFLQGISDSFSDCRRGVEARQTEQSERHGVFRRLTTPWRRLRHILRRQRIDIRQQQLQQRMQASHREGYCYHRQMMTADPSIRQWVLRADYWNASLPVLADEARTGEYTANENPMVKL